MAMQVNQGYALDPGFKTLLASVGVEHGHVLRTAELPEDLLNRPNARVNAQQFSDFLEAIHTVADDPLLPLRLAEGVNAESFSPPVFAALCSPDLTVAAERLAKFKTLIAPVELQIDSGSTGLQIRYNWLHGELGPPEFFAGTEALFLVKLAQLGTRQPVRARDVSMPRLPKQQSAFEDFLGCAIRRSPQLSVTFSAEDAQRPFLTQNGAMWEIFEPQLRKRLFELEGSATYAQRSRAVLLELMPSGQVAVGIVARRLGVSSRTLQRRLLEEGTSFKEVVRETREDLSHHYLAQTELTTSEISYLLGFEEPNSFIRAFRGWTGMTPNSLRHSN